MRCRSRPATTRHALPQRRNGWKACAAITRRCGGSSSMPIFGSSRRRSKHTAKNSPNGWSHTMGSTRRRTFCGPRRVRCRAAGHWLAISCLPADMVFWDGAQPIAIELAARDTDRQRALLTAGVTVHRIDPSMFARLDAILPATFSRFWEGQTLPSSPFRRAIPSGVLHDAAPVIASKAKQSPSHGGRTPMGIASSLHSSQ